MLNEVQNNHNSTPTTPIILNPDMLEIEENTIASEQLDVEPVRSNRRPLLEARRRRHARIGGRY